MHNDSNLIEMAKGVLVSKPTSLLAITSYVLRLRLIRHLGYGSSEMVRRMALVETPHNIKIQQG